VIPLVALVVDASAPAIDVELTEAASAARAMTVSSEGTAGVASAANLPLRFVKAKREGRGLNSITNILKS